MRLLLAHWEVKVSVRSEPWRGCCWLIEKSEERGPWVQVQGVGQRQAALPIVPLVASLMGTLRI